MEKFTAHNAKEIGDDLGINWNEVKLDEFTKGLNIELEHGTRYPETNVTNNDKNMTGKIAWAHLKEFPDYYTRLEKLENEAVEYWKEKDRTD
ncbi:MAG: hypothetical protein IPM96_11180 [Ignavibacteria bacterium]|nr:hypothetical protein [Ignavibacteria bacterium]